MRIGKVPLAVDKRLSCEGLDHATGRPQYGIAGGNVPFHSPAQPRIKIGLARRHEAEFE